MKELRAAFVKSLDVGFIAGDEVFTIEGKKIALTSSGAERTNKYESFDLMTVSSFAPRKSTCVQPCGDDVPVVITYNDSHHHFCVLACEVSWQFTFTWKPDLESIIKMQAEHDALTNELCNKNDPALIRLGEMAKKHNLKNHPEQLIYTPEIALTHGKPEPEMLCRVEHKHFLTDRFAVDEHKHFLTDRFAVDELTFKFETDKEICLIGKDGSIAIIDKEWFIAFHPISTKTELEAAQEKQIDNLLPMIDFIGGDTELNRARLVKLQENNELAEIVSPLEK